MSTICSAVPRWILFETPSSALLQTALIICVTGTSRFFNVLLKKTLLNPILGKMFEDKLLHNNWTVSELLESQLADSVMKKDLRHSHQLLLPLRHKNIENLLSAAVHCRLHERFASFPHASVRRVCACNARLSTPTCNPRTQSPANAKPARNPQTQCPASRQKRRPSRVSSRKGFTDASKISCGTNPTIPTVSAKNLRKKDYLHKSQRSVVAQVYVGPKLPQRCHSKQPDHGH